MNPFPEKPTMVQLTEGATRIPHGESRMVFEPGRMGLDYRYGKDPVGILGRPYQVWVLRPGITSRSDLRNHNPARLILFSKLVIAESREMAVAQAENQWFAGPSLGWSF